MFPGSLLTFACLAASAKFVSATPPACLLGAVTTQPNPADLSQICGPGASKVEGQIRSMCAGNTSAAMSAFSSICSSAGHQMATTKTTKTSTTAVTRNTKASTHSSSQSVSHSQTETQSQIVKTAEPTVIGHANGESTVDVKSTTLNIPNTPKIILTATGGAPQGGTNATSVAAAVTTPAGPSGMSDGPAKYTGTGSARRVDADGFATLALAAAGLLIFL